MYDYETFRLQTSKHRKLSKGIEHCTGAAAADASYNAIFILSVLQMVEMMMELMVEVDLL